MAVHQLPCYFAGHGGIINGSRGASASQKTGGAAGRCQCNASAGSGRLGSGLRFRQHRLQQQRRLCSAGRRCTCASAPSPWSVGGAGRTGARRAATRVARFVGGRCNSSSVVYVGSSSGAITRQLFRCGPRSARFQRSRERREGLHCQRRRCVRWRICRRRVRQQGSQGRRATVALVLAEGEDLTCILARVTRDTLQGLCLNCCVRDAMAIGGEAEGGAVAAHMQVTLGLTYCTAINPTLFRRRSPTGACSNTAACGAACCALYRCQQVLGCIGFAFIISIVVITASAVIIIFTFSHRKSPPLPPSHSLRSVPRPLQRRAATAAAVCTVRIRRELVQFLPHVTRQQQRQL
jgi:hypothetical protein